MGDIIVIDMSLGVTNKLEASIIDVPITQNESASDKTFPYAAASVGWASVFTEIASQISDDNVRAAAILFANIPTAGFLFASIREFVNHCRTLHRK